MTDIAIYEGPGGQIEVRVDRENIWLAQAQLAELFGRDQSVISRHVRNVFADGELELESNMQKMHIAGSDKPVALYNLDVIISVGYRVKSREGVRFRQWATRTLKEHLTRGYTLNRQRHGQLTRLVNDISFHALGEGKREWSTVPRKPLDRAYGPCCAVISFN